MTETLPTPSPLRIVAAILFGIIVGTILFFIVALFIGAFNNITGMHLVVNTNVDMAENIGSLIILIVFILLSVAGFCWKVWTTPPSEPEPVETPE